MSLDDLAPSVDLFQLPLIQIIPVGATPPTTIQPDKHLVILLDALSAIRLGDIPKPVIRHAIHQIVLSALLLALPLRTLLPLLRSLLQVCQRLRLLHLQQLLLLVICQLAPNLLRLLLHRRRHLLRADAAGDEKAATAAAAVQILRLRSGAFLVLALGVNSHGVEGRLLGRLGLDGLDQGQQVGHVLVFLGPLGLGEQLVRDGALHGAADAEDAVVAGGGVEAGEGGLDGLGLLGDEVVGAVEGRGTMLVFGQLAAAGRRAGRLIGRRYLQSKRMFTELRDGERGAAQTYRRPSWR